MGRRNVGHDPADGLCLPHIDRGRRVEAQLAGWRRNGTRAAEIEAYRIAGRQGSLTAGLHIGATAYFSRNQAALAQQGVGTGYCPDCHPNIIGKIRCGGSFAP